MPCMGMFALGVTVGAVGAFALGLVVVCVVFGPPRHPLELQKYEPL
jgi:hypothetical protein